METDYNPNLILTKAFRWLGLAVAVIGAIAMVTGIADYAGKRNLLAHYEEQAESFDPFDVLAALSPDSVQSVDAYYMTYEFASDFKETDFYYIVFDENYFPYIIKLKASEAEQYQYLIDALYDYSEDAPLPEPVTFRGISAFIEDDIKEFALETFNYMYGDSYLTADEFDTYVGTCMLDTTLVPERADTSDAMLQITFGVLGLIGGIILFFVLTKRLKNISVDAYGNHVDAYGNPIRTDSQPSDTYANLTGTNTNPSKRTFIPSKPSNPILGLIGAIGGSLVGVVLWVIVGKLGFIAGIVGVVMLRFALKGYEKLGGGLDKKGAVISLIVAALMITGANVMEFIVELCQAYFTLEFSWDTAWYVIRSFPQLMTECDLWGAFGANLLIGYVLSILSCRSMIKAILTYKDPEV